MGKIIRLMSIQLSLRFRGMTGWKARTFWTRLYGPMLKFVVFRIGTLIRSATGFCAALRSSSSESAVPLVGDAGVLPGASWEYACPSDQNTQSVMNEEAQRETLAVYTARAIHK